MKIISTLVLLLFFSTSFSQWKRVEQLPASNISSLCLGDSTLYAGGNDIVYFSKNKGQSWDSTATIPGLRAVDAIIAYKNELYASSYRFGVYKSDNDGSTWENIGAGIFPFISEFFEWRGDLYASTLGGGIFKLDPVRHNSWISFNTGLSSLSVNLNSIGGNNNALIAGTIANRLYDRIAASSGIWDELFITGNNSPGDGVYDIVAAHDSLFMVTHTTVYLSTDDGLVWNKIGNPLPSLFTNLLNTKQAIILAKNTFDGAFNNTNFYYIRKDSLQHPFVSFSAVHDHFTYRMEILGDKLWDASLHGLYYLSLADLPGIFSAEEKDTVASDTGNPVGQINYPFSVGLVYPNPVTGDGHIEISLDTAEEISASLYDIAGKLVSVPANHLALPKGRTTFSFRMANLNSGAYFLRLSVNDKIIVRKIIHLNQ